MYHHTSSDQRTSYEANLRAAYDLIRSGKIIHLAKEELGEEAALVVAHILSVGQVTVNDLQKFWKQNHRNSEEQGANHTDQTEGAEGRLSNVLKRLVHHGFVHRVRRAHFSTPADNYFDAESQQLALEDGTAAKGRKGQDELRAKIMEEMASRNDASISPADVICSGSTGSKRQASDGSDGTIRKKTKLTNGASSSLHSVTSNSIAGDGFFVVRALQASLLSKLTLPRRLSQFVSITTKSLPCSVIAA